MCLLKDAQIRFMEKCGVDGDVPSFDVSMYRDIELGLVVLDGGPGPDVEKCEEKHDNSSKWDNGWVWLGDCNDRGSWMQILFNRSKKVNEIITANVVVPGSRAGTANRAVGDKESTSLPSVESIGKATSVIRQNRKRRLFHTRNGLFAGGT